jgi:predicted GNAT family N-acyltransferase
MQDMLIMTCDMKDFSKVVTESLKDGTKITLRLLTVNEDDLNKLLKFYQALPFSDRKYLKVDVTKKDVVEKRLHSIVERLAVRVIALHEENIVAEGELFLVGDDWHRDEGEIRVIVARDFQRKGLGMILMRELYSQALNHKLEHLVAKMMTPQTGFQNILQKFGFKEGHVLPKYALDQDKHKQDMLIMTCDMKDFWRELEGVYKQSDWQRCR